MKKILLVGFWWTIIEFFILRPVFAEPALPVESPDGSLSSVTEIPVPAPSRGFTLSRLNYRTGIIGSGWYRSGGSSATVDADLGSRAGGLFGASAEWGHTVRVLEIGLEWRRMGTTWDPAWTTRDGGLSWARDREGSKVDIRVDYLMLPIHGKYYAGPKAGQGIFFRGGLIPAFAVSKSYDKRSATSPDLGLTSIRTFDLLVSIGAGVNFSTGSDNDSKISIGADYNQGLFDVTTIDGRNVRNAAVMLTAGVTFSM